MRDAIEEYLDQVMAYASLARRDRARVRVREGFRSDRYVDLIQRLVAFAQVPPLVGDWAAPAPDVLPGLVAPTWKHLQRAVSLQGVFRAHGPLTPL